MLNPWKQRVSESCTHKLQAGGKRGGPPCPPLNALTVEAKEHGRTEYAKQGKATYNAISAENADTDSAKQVGTGLTTLNMFKEFIESH
jgi:hypothetical protein